MYAIVEIAGKQFKVQKDAKLYIPRTKDAVGDTVTIDRVLLVSGDDGVQVGAPTVSGFSVSAEVLAHVKGDKVVVFKKKRRKGYKVRNGHRQPFTQVKITGLSSNYASRARALRGPRTHLKWHTRKALARRATAATPIRTCSA